ncbi:hypothetical protein CTAYLR_005225 [Chrysophaeum taylorii]|uniref:Uncharacterized protein n=1 Tax=Chrysophaeum taylorii TaxID=2483200 RepID=A0AAD7XKK5_9STRA|nr:hypothetical protein CTAYLR_005225 [Chrysophaeum taylorii]
MKLSADDDSKASLATTAVAVVQAERLKKKASAADAVRAKKNELSPEDFATLKTQQAAKAYIRGHPVLRRSLNDRFVPTGDHMLQLALMFETGGLGVAKSEYDALQCHVFASELGQMRSKGIMGEYYERGIVIKRNAKKAWECYRVAARSGDARAQCNIARIQYHGLLGQRQNKHNARVLWETALMKHHRAAQAALGYCHEKGIGGLKPDPNVAKRMYAAAAHQGCARSAFNLGRVYELNLLKLDKCNDDHRLAFAIFYYDRALSLGYERAAERLDVIARATENDNKPHNVDTEADDADHEQSHDESSTGLQHKPKKRASQAEDNETRVEDSDPPRDVAAVNEHIIDRPR